ncbi:hypothetical protein [Kitasatospora paranensis]|uniref:Peptidase inhibitor family I36 n=1 Tax=Kitasatospora paranensis TaxID=258053 RepID=A0ABW2FWR1_9ACTN
MSFVRKSAFVAAAAVTAAVLGSGIAFADNTSSCTDSDNGAGGDACLYFNSNYAGARVGDPYANNYTDSGKTYTFHSWAGGSNGAGVAVKNNAASVSNWDHNLTLHIWYNSNQQGAVQTIGVFGDANLNSTLKNENASQSWG